MQRFRVWARIEVIETDTDVRKDLDPDICEYCIFATDNKEKLVEYLSMSTETNADALAVILDSQIIDAGFTNEG